MHDRSARREVAFRGKFWRQLGEWKRPPTMFTLIMFQGFFDQESSGKGREWKFGQGNEGIVKESHIREPRYKVYFVTSQPSY